MKQAPLFLIIMLTLLSITGCKSIFHVDLENHIDQNNNEETNNELNIENIPIEQLPIELDIVKGEYRAIWKENYKYNTPILIYDLKDFKRFLSDHPAQSANDDILQKTYNDEFFNQNVIYAFVKSEGSGSVGLTVNKAEIDEDTLKLFMDRIVPGDGTDDMASRICLFGINREDIKDIKEVEGIILDKSLK